ncbi:MAG: DEAD/DEAH box helicase, partial [bacterium]|nr:DEAD/DEAH box helicase [bacterium]
MEIDFLRHFHFTASQLEVLQKAYGPRLLPLQERVIEENHLLDGRSLLLCAPTSSGKTFLAEILFLSHVLKNRKVILLVPTKALASQRHEQLRQRYEPLGYEIVLSTRDHPFHDKRILEGRFHLAVMIYEKLEPLLRLSPALLAGVGACVIDEIHYLFDPNRGPDLEVLLTRLRDEASVQLLGLSAVVSDPAIARWLKADLLVERARPVELRQGVLCGNRFTYTEFNTGQEGHETFPFDPPENEAELMRQTALYFAARGEITLLFWPRRDLCYTFARKLAETYEPDPDWNGAALEALEPTFLHDFLALLLPRRVAVHTSDLSQEERRVVESAIQKGEVVLICATGTLAEGINFPVINVLTTQRMYASNVDEKSQGRPPAALPIPQDRLFNMVGRAGRLGLSDFGRGMIVTQSPGDVDGLLGLYAAGQAPQFEPWLHRIDLATVILKLMGDCGYFTLEGCLERLHSTLSGQWNRFLGDLAEKT